MRILSTVFCGVIALAGMALSASGQDVPFATKVVGMEYPRLAQLARMTGIAMLQVRIDSNGKVTRATGVFGWPLLIDKAKANIVLWTFSAGKSAGGVARSEFDFAYDFELKGEPDAPAGKLAWNKAAASCRTPKVKTGAKHETGGRAAGTSRSTPGDARRWAM